MDIAKRSEEGPQSLFGNQWRKTSDKHSGVVRICGRQLLAIWAYEVTQDSPSLYMMLPRFLIEDVVALPDLRFVGIFSGVRIALCVLLGDLSQYVTWKIHHIFG